MSGLSIKGTITLDDGTVSEFLIDNEAGIRQWGADTQRLGRSVDIVEAMLNGLVEEDLLSNGG